MLLARPARIPDGIVTIAVGGATFGGSGKTRVAIDIAKGFVDQGRSVVLIGHAYRAKPGRARIVRVDDPIEEVGDEALVCAAAVTTVVAPSRQRAIDFACMLDRRPEVLVFDGPLQLSPDRASLSVLAVDAHEPWGLVPRARPSTLLAAADVVVEVDARPDPRDLERIRGKTIGLFTALGRPRRLVRALAREGIFPSVVVEARDHGPAPRLPDVRVDLWVATEKCALHLMRRKLSAELLVLRATPTWAALTPLDVRP